MTVSARTAKLVMTLANQGITTPQGMYQEMIKQMAIEVNTQKDKVICDFIQDEIGSAILDVEDIKKRGYLKRYTDGIEEFIWDGHPRIRFGQVTTSIKDDVMRPTLPFQYIAKPEAEQPKPLPKKPKVTYKGKGPGQKKRVKASTPYKGAKGKRIAKLNDMHSPFVDHGEDPPHR